AERSRSLSRSEAVFDVDPRHTAAAPVVRRIKNPADHDPLYAWVSLESPILDIVAELLGPSIRFHHSKLNLKGGHIGAPVEVHQDAAFYPHSNDDVRAVGLRLDDATAENGAMPVLPGSHRGPIYTHYDAQDRFVGGMRAEEIAQLDRSGARLLALPAGSIHIHHYRLVHWSAPNTPPRDRPPAINAQAPAHPGPPPPATRRPPRPRSRRPRPVRGGRPGSRRGRIRPARAAPRATCRCRPISAAAIRRSTSYRATSRRSPRRSRGNVPTPSALDGSGGKPL